MNKYSVQKLPGDILEETAAAYRRRRKHLKLTQVQLASRSGVSLGSLKRFEQRGKIAFEALLKLAHILGTLGRFEALFAEEVDRAKIEKLFSDKMRQG